MSTAVFDDRDQRQATSRAQAAAIADAPRPARRFAVTAGTRLRASPRPRRHNPKRPPAIVVKRRASSKRRLLTVAALFAQVVLLLLALNLPVFQVRQVTVGGTRLLGRDSVLMAAAVPNHSIFIVDTQAVSARIEALPWVQSATVSAELPASVRISVVERSPALRVRRGGAEWLVAGNGATLAEPRPPEAAWSSLPVLFDNRVGSPQPVPAALVRMLSEAAQRYPAVLGCTVAAFEWDVDGVLAIWASSGWRAVLGHADTVDAVARVPSQLAMLGALRGSLNFSRPSFGYVDLENAAAPAVGGKPGLPPELAATPSR